MVITLAYLHLEIYFQIQNLALLFFENFLVDFQVSYFKEKNYQGEFYQIHFPLSTYKSYCFKEVYDFMYGRGWDSPDLEHIKHFFEFDPYFNFIIAITD